jgi:holo-[acyl-carrier protein] synthase
MFKVVSLKEGNRLLYGIGHDLVEINRVQKIMERSCNERFAKRILTPAELRLSGNSSRPVEFLSGRFAAKEAVSKAFGFGIGKMIGFHDIVVLPDANGKPYVQISDQAWQRMALELQQYQIHLSITHERALASAFVVIEHKGENNAPTNK